MESGPVVPRAVRSRPSVVTSIVDQPINGVPSVLASLTKGGLNAATKSLAIEYAKRGIRVNAVAPGHQDPAKPAGDPRNAGRLGTCRAGGAR
jgi:NAD(P)-dependent dehydrogenase (short-subunit alcohol dehydrogenase family)